MSTTNYYADDNGVAVVTKIHNTIQYNDKREVTIPINGLVPYKYFAIWTLVGEVTNNGDGLSIYVSNYINTYSVFEIHDASDVKSGIMMRKNLANFMQTVVEEEANILIRDEDRLLHSTKVTL